MTLVFSASYMSNFGSLFGGAVLFGDGERAGFASCESCLVGLCQGENLLCSMEV